MKIIPPCKLESGLFLKYQVQTGQFPLTKNGSGLPNMYLNYSCIIHAVSPDIFF